METAGFFAAQVWETVVERSAARELIQRLTDDLVPSREREEDLTDREYHLGLFRWREEHILSGRRPPPEARHRLGRRPVRRLQRLPGPRARHRARARAPRAAGGVLRGDRALRGRRAARRRSTGCATCTRSAEIERDRAWFQEHGRISSTRAKAVTRTVNSLCAELRPHAEALVDAFGIPDEVLAAPIGLPGGEASRTGMADLGDELPDVKAILAEGGEEALEAG